MAYRIPQPILDFWFRIAIYIKGLDGVIEFIGGLLLLVIPFSSVQDAVTDFAFYEIQPGQHAFIGNYVLHLSNKLDPHLQLVAALYLLLQGTLKIMLVVALVRRMYFLYPWAIGFMVAFIIYLAYRIGYDHSVTLAVLTAFDCVVAYLAYLEWKRHKDNPDLA